MRTAPPPPRPYAPPATFPQILHADEWLLVADKPAGLLSVPGRGDDKQDSALSRLEERHGPLQVVHRLDMDTSGLLLFARDRKTARALAAAFEARLVDKTYTACVHGHPSTMSGCIDLPIGRDWAARPLRHIDHERGRPALTRWRLDQQLSSTSLLRLTPVTGRTHQLRLHLAAIGLPIAGDRLYGRSDGLYRLHLHATEIAFEHPGKKEKIQLISPPTFGDSEPAAK